jgi:hypothetical protein
MDLWQRHALRLRRQAELKRMDRWCLEHPRHAHMIAIGLGLLVFELSQFLRLALQALGAWAAR